MEEMQLEELVNEIALAQLRYEGLAFDEVRSHSLGLPASEEAILSLEARLGASLPADYRAFLELYDGWQNFHGDGKLLATGEQDARWVAKKMRYWTDLWDSEDPNPFARGALPIMLGESLHYFVVLDPTRRGPDGTAAIVEYDGMQERRTLASFRELLQGELNVLQRLIKRELHGLPEDDDEDAPAGSQS